jgi:P27 family predicted phage terminase small subunit
MGLRGPKPTPTAILKRRGSTIANRNPKEPKPPKGIPECPKALVGEARKEWDRITHELTLLNVITTVDGASLACYCQSWADYLEAIVRLKKDGKVITSPTGQIKLNPWNHVANKARDAVLKFSAQFGLTPSSRARVETIEPPQDNTASGDVISLLRKAQ